MTAGRDPDACPWRMAPRTGITGTTGGTVPDPAGWETGRDGAERCKTETDLSRRTSRRWIPDNDSQAESKHALVTLNVSA